MRIPAEKNIQVEQLRLLLNNVSSSLIPAILLIALLTWSQINDHNRISMLTWSATLTSAKLAAVLHAKYLLKSGIPHDRIRRTILELLVFGAITGFLWGAAAWIAMDTGSVVSSVMLVAAIAAIGANGMSLFSTVFPVFLTYVIAMAIPLEHALWAASGASFLPLILSIVVYIIVLVMYAKNNSRATRTAITLRFENIALIERLRQETAKAEEANLAKSKFLAAASHDLRQPIHALGLYLDALNRPELPQDQRLALVGKAIAVSEATSEILNTLLDFSRIEAGVIEPHIHTFRLQPLLNKIESELAPQADAAKLLYRTRETHLAVETDPVLLKLMLRNLVMNAIRYTRRGGILVGCRKRGEFVHLEVWDTGIGIAPEQQQEVFREFHQLGNPERDHRKGLGLGLSIVDRLARQLGIPLLLLSRPHCGSMFRLRIPIARDVVAINDFDTPRVNEVHRLTARVIVIDDEEAVRDGMQHLLQDWGCICVAAESIEEALAAAKDFCPDVVISDYRLREHHTGAEAIAALRSACGADLPALIITGDTAPERLREALASGIPLLHKPVSPAQLNQSLFELLSDTGRAHPAP